jgi:hypothetical protein
MKIVWVTVATDLIGTAATVDSKVASVRYRALMPAVGLRALGHDAVVIGHDRDALEQSRRAIADADVVVFRRNYEDPECIESLLGETAAAGIKTVFDLSDDRLHGRVGPHLRRMVELAGAVVTTSDSLRAKISEEYGKDAFVIGDPFEGPRGEPRWQPGPRLKVLWFGHPVNLPSLEQSLPALLQACRKKPMDLRIVTERVDGIERQCKDFNSKNRNLLSMRFAEWSHAETWRSLVEADFVVIPYIAGHPRSLAKSPNRIIESLWAGRFVVAQPIPSYLEFSEWAWIGEDIAGGISWMIDNPAAIAPRIAAAQQHIVATYSAERISADWEKITKQL